MITLRHNTDLTAAISILKERRFRRGGTPGRDWTYGAGPYFFVEGWKSTEVKAGGQHEKADLLFTTDLPLIGVQRSKFSGYSVSQTPDEHGIVAIDKFREGVTCCYVGSEFSEAVIVPPHQNRLRLVGWRSTEKPTFWSETAALKKIAERLIAEEATISVA